jgi:hypothetical protein
MRQALAGAVLSSLVLFVMLLSGSAAADAPAPDRSVSYDYLTKYGRPAGIYAMSESHDDGVCRELLSLLNARFKLTGPEALEDHVYLLHTPHDVEWRDVKWHSLVGESHGFFGVAGQPASDPTQILRLRSRFGGYEHDTLYLLSDEALRDGSDQRGLLTLDFVRALEKDENGRHATVSAHDWIRAQPGFDDSKSDAHKINRWDDWYWSSVLALNGGYYAFITTDYPIDDRGYVLQGLVVLAFRLDWKSLKQPLCAFVH